jgi:hypothetical protein
LKGDQRRYFVPCPHCQRDIVFAWSKEYTAFPLKGFEAFVRWDPEAKRADGSWDLDRVERTAHAECPHCHGKILDSQKTAMVRAGKWVATAEHPTPGFVSRHLPSMYAASPETTFGKLAVKFLKAKDKLGFITGDLAEPYQGQDIARKRTELVSVMLDKEGAAKLMTVDCQAKSPHFWYVVRAWKSGNSEAIRAGQADSWEELRAIQESEQIPDPAVFVDSGYGAKDDAEVYRNCARFGTPIQYGGRTVSVGWMPTKGMPGRKRWANPQTKLMLPLMVRSIDPHLGTAAQGMVAVDMLEFSTDSFKDLLQTAREKRGTGIWSVAKDVATEEYWRHLDAEHKAVLEDKFGRRKHTWMLRSKGWPNHLFDCEVIQLAAAAYLGLFAIEAEKEKGER